MSMGDQGGPVEPIEPGGPGGTAGEAFPPVYGRSAPARGAHRRSDSGHPVRTVVLVVVLVVVLALVGGYVWLQSEASPSGPEGPQVIVTVRPGTGTSQLASTLQSRHVIGSSLAYRIWGQFHTLPGVLSGAYAFRQNSSFATVNRIITGGPNVFPLQIPPGFTVSEVARRVGQLPGHSGATFAKVATDGTVHSPWQPAGSTNLDGLLGTGTYIVVPGETDIQLLTAMVRRFNSIADQVQLTTGAAKLGLTPYQVIIAASIVQKEGFVVKNMGPVARVILNRLAKDMPLQMDSTVLYAEGRDGGPVTSKDLAVKSPYNSYLNKGLTPTPICFPSTAALQAALDPPAGSWLYFVVVRSDGTEAFADTFAEQKANEALAQTRGLP
jgi:UPF0755 protein